MRLRFVVALAALAALSACDQVGQRGGTARAPIGGAPAAAGAPSTPAPVASTTPAANCPTVAPACPTPHKAVHKPARPAMRRTHVRHYATYVPPTPHRARIMRAPPAYAYRDQGLPRRPYRYEDLPRGQAVITLPYAEDHARPPRRPHYPPPYMGRGWSGDRYARHEGYGENHVYRYEERPAPRYEAPPAEDRAYGGRYGYDEPSQRRWSESDDRAELPPLPPRPLPPRMPEPPRASNHEHYEHYDRAAGGYDRYGQAYRADEHREYRSYSEQSSTSLSAATERDCCTAGGGQAAGFDAHGYLTWPGKTPR